MSARKMIVAAGLAVGTAVVPSAALAVDDYVGPPPPNQQGNSFSPPAEVRGVTLTRAPEVGAGAEETGGATLPVTGGDLLGMAALGLGAVATGAVLVRRGRTRAVTA